MRIERRRRRSTYGPSSTAVSTRQPPGQRERRRQPHQHAPRDAVRAPGQEVRKRAIRSSARRRRRRAPCRAAPGTSRRRSSAPADRRSASATPVANAQRDDGAARRPRTGSPRSRSRPRAQPTANSRRALRTSARFSSALSERAGDEPALHRHRQPRGRPRRVSAARARSPAPRRSPRTTASCRGTAPVATMRQHAPGAPPVYPAADCSLRWSGRTVSQARIQRSAELSPVMNISYTHHRLDNGLDVLIHEDHACPIVAVNLWYHVGSKNETPGRTGFAHLFEHLMFEGSQHYDHGLLPAAAGGRRAAERLDERRPHELLGGRAAQRPRAGAVDGIRSDGLPAARRSPTRSSRTSATSS